MKLTGELKDKVENAESKEEAKKILKDAGIELTDTELDQVSGGVGEADRDGRAPLVPGEALKVFWEYETPH